MSKVLKYKIQEGRKHGFSVFELVMICPEGKTHQSCHMSREGAKARVKAFRHSYNRKKAKEKSSHADN